MADMQGYRRKMAEGHELTAQAFDAYAAAHGLYGSPEMVEHSRRMAAGYREMAAELRAAAEHGFEFERVTLPADIARPMAPEVAS